MHFEKNNPSKSYYSSSGRILFLDSYSHVTKLEDQKTVKDLLKVYSWKKLS